MDRGAEDDRTAVIVTRPGDEVLLCGSLLAALAEDRRALDVVHLGSACDGNGIAAGRGELGVPGAAVPAGLANVRWALAGIRPRLVVTTAADPVALDAIVAGCPRSTVVYRCCLPARLFQDDPVAVRRLGLVSCPEGDISAVIDTAAFRQVRERAIARLGALAAPLDGVPALVRRTVLTSDHLQLIRPPSSAGPLQTAISNLLVNR